MASVFPGFPDLPQHTMSVELGGATYRLTFTWRERTRGWYLDLHTEDGAPVLLGRRLSPGSGPALGVTPEVLEDVLLLVLGREPYEQADLGREGLRLLELELGDEESSPTSGLTVTLGGGS